MTWRGKGFFFLREFHHLRTGHRGPPILATKTPKAEPTATTPGTPGSKRRVLAISHAVVAVRKAGRNPLHSRGPYGRVAQRGTTGICHLHCVACVRRSRGRWHDHTPIFQTVRATCRRAKATGQSWSQNRPGSRGRLHRSTKGACSARLGFVKQGAAGGGS